MSSKENLILSQLGSWISSRRFQQKFLKTKAAQGCASSWAVIQCGNSFFKVLCILFGNLRRQRPLIGSGFDKITPGNFAENWLGDLPSNHRVCNWVIPQVEHKPLTRGAKTADYRPPSIRVDPLKYNVVGPMNCNRTMGTFWGHKCFPSPLSCQATTMFLNDYFHPFLTKRQFAV